MHPTEIIELLTICGLLILIMITTFLLPAKRRKYGYILFGIVTVSYATFYLVRPHWLDYQITEKVTMLETYLEEKYVHEKWEITTVPHRESGYKHVNPYYIGVTFDNEPDVTYHYWVDKDGIYQVSYSTNKNLDELKYREDSS